jgi:hypothetical protein
MPRNREFVRTDDYISTKLDGEEVILHKASENYFGLNAVGTQLWESLEEPRTIDDLVTTIREEFDVSEEQSRKDVESFVDDLEAADLVEVSDESGS